MLRFALAATAWQDRVEYSVPNSIAVGRLDIGVILVTSSFSGGASRPGVPRLPTRPTGWPVGSYDNYEQAQRAVDYLSDQQFPVQQVTIVGVDLMQVERVTGRLSWPKVLGGGVISGAWLGLFIGLVLGFFSPNPWAALVTGLVAGVFFGLITSAVPYAMARGTRDFSSTMQLVAGRYDVLCDPQNAEKARDLLARLAI